MKLFRKGRFDGSVRMRSLGCMWLLVVCIFCVTHQRAQGATWTNSVFLSADGIDATSPMVTINDAGQTVAIWVRGGETQVAKMTFGGAWSSPASLRSLFGEIGYAPSVKINASGQALAVWGEGFFNEPYSGVFSATLLFEKDWCNPIGAYMGELDQDARLAFNDAGQGVVVLDNEVAPSEVKVTKYCLGGNWDKPFVLSDVGYPASDARVTMNATGRIGITWKQTDGVNTRIYGHLSTYHGFWPSIWPMYGEPLSAAGQDAQTPRIVMNGDDQTVIVWSRSNGFNQIVQKSWLMIGEKWSTSTDLSAAGQDAIDPQVAMNDAGQIVFVWTRSNGTHTIVQAATTVYGVEPTSVVDLSDAGQNAISPQVAMNGAGQAVVVWCRNGIAQASTLNFGGSWSAPVDLSAAGQDASFPDVAMNAKGEAVAVWSWGNTIDKRIQASMLTAKPASPLKFSGVQLMASSPNRVFSYYNKLYWEPSPSTNVVGYRVYRNGTLIATVNKSLTRYYYDDWYQPQGVAQTYQVSAVTSGGEESVKATITVP